jgi:hypothetical protein
MPRAVPLISATFPSSLPIRCRPFPPGQRLVPRRTTVHATLTSRRRGGEITKPYGSYPQMPGFLVLRAVASADLHDLVFQRDYRIIPAIVNGWAPRFDRFPMN